MGLLSRSKKIHDNKLYALALLSVPDKSRLSELIATIATLFPLSGADVREVLGNLPIILLDEVMGKTALAVRDHLITLGAVASLIGDTKEKKKIGVFVEYEFKFDLARNFDKLMKEGTSKAGFNALRESQECDIDTAGPQDPRRTAKVTHMALQSAGVDEEQKKKTALPGDVGLDPRQALEAEVGELRARIEVLQQDCTAREKEARELVNEKIGLLSRVDELKNRPADDGRAARLEAALGEAREETAARQRQLDELKARSAETEKNLGELSWLREEIDKLSAERDAGFARAESAEGRTAELEQELETLRASAGEKEKALSAELESLGRSAADARNSFERADTALKTELEELRRIRQELEGKAAGMEDELNHLRQHVEAMSEGDKEVERKMEEKDTRIRELETELEKLGQELRGAQEQSGGIGAELEKARGEKEEFVTALGSKDAMIAELNSRVQDGQTRAAELENTLSGLKEQLAQAGDSSERAKELEGEIDALKTAADQTQRELDEFKEKLAAAGSAAQGRVAELEAEIETLKSGSGEKEQALGAELETLKTESALVRAGLEEQFAGREEELGKSVQALESRMAETEKKLAAAEKAAEEKEAAARDAGRELKARENELAAAGKEAGKLEAALGKLQEKADSLDEKVKAMGADIVSKDIQLDDMNIKFEGSRKVIADLKKDVEKRDGEISGLEKELSDSQADCVGLRKDMAAFEKESAQQKKRLDLDLDVARSELEGARENIARLKDELDGFKKNLSERNSELSAERANVKALKAEMEKTSAFMRRELENAVAEHKKTLAKLIAFTEKSIKVEVSLKEQAERKGAVASDEIEGLEKERDKMNANLAAVDKMEGLSELLREHQKQEISTRIDTLTRMISEKTRYRGLVADWLDALESASEKQAAFMEDGHNRTRALDDLPPAPPPAPAKAKEAAPPPPPPPPPAEPEPKAEETKAEEKPAAKPVSKKELKKTGPVRPRFARSKSKEDSAGGKDSEGGKSGAKLKGLWGSKLKKGFSKFSASSGKGDTQQKDDDKQAAPKSGAFAASVSEIDRYKKKISKYTVDQLQDILNHINPEKFPEKFSAVQEELNERES